MSGQLFAVRKGTSLAVALKPDENVRSYDITLPYATFIVEAPQ